MDPVDFLVQHAPFSELGEEGRSGLGRHLEISWAKAGERFFRRQSENPHLFVIRKGGVRLELDGQRIEELGAGDVFGLGAVTRQPTRFDAVATADCLLYRLEGTVVRSWFDAEPAFARFFLDQLSDRLRALTEGGAVALRADLAIPVGRLCSRAPVAIEQAATAGDAARRMERERVGSLLVVEDSGSLADPVGILTDRDLRGRVLARGLGPETPVREIMSSPVTAVSAEVPISEALLAMLRAGVHHLPIEDDGAVVGVVSHSDLLQYHRNGPGALYKRIEKAESAAALSSYAEDVAAVVETLHHGRLEGADVGRLVAALGDALASRLLSHAERDLGPPPCPYSWIVFGSEGRQEQSLLTDQDNALIYERADPKADAYFEALAERVVGDLVSVGFPPCAGGFMATSWHKPLDAWCQLFRGWIDEPEPQALLEAANFFDFRSIYGALDLEPLEEIVRLGSHQRVFLAQLTRAALEMRPPLGLLNRIRESPQGVDLKAAALMPTVGLARLLALEAGDRRGSTLGRLHLAQRAGKLSKGGAELLTEAFRFVFELRLRHQLRARAAGQEITNHVHLDELSPAERRHLREAFVALRRFQSATAERLGVDRLG